MGSIFDKPTSGKKGAGGLPPVKKPIEMREFRIGDVDSLVQLEKLSYRQAQKGDDGKFLVPMKTATVTDADFEVEIQPAFLLGKDGFERISKQLGRAMRMNVVVSGEQVIGSLLYGIDHATCIIDVGLVLLHPLAPMSVMPKMFKWFEGLAENSLKEVTVIYDLPDALDTPMQHIFTFLRDSGWNWKLKRDVYAGRVDAWQFKKTYGVNQYKKGTKEAV